MYDSGMTDCAIAVAYFKLVSEHSVSLWFQVRSA